MRVRVLVGLVVCLLSFRVAQAQQTENAPFGKLSGKVTDQETREPVPDVDVVVKLNGAIQGHATTDRKGFYSVTPLAPATYTVEFSGDCFQPVSFINVPIAVDKTRFLNAAMCETVGVEPVEACVFLYKLPSLVIGSENQENQMHCGESFDTSSLLPFSQMWQGSNGSTHHTIDRNPAAAIRIR